MIFVIIPEIKSMVLLERIAKIVNIWSNLFFVRRMRSFECRELVTEPKCRISLLHLLICKTCWNCPDHILFLPFIYRRRKSLSWPILFPLSWSCIRCKQVKCQFNVSASYYTYGVDDVKAPWQFSRTSFISTFAILYDIITRLTILLLF